MVILIFSLPSLTAPHRETMCLKIIFSSIFFLALSLPEDFKKDFSEVIYLNRVWLRTLRLTAALVSNFIHVL